MCNLCDRVEFNFLFDYLPVMLIPVSVSSYIMCVTGHDSTDSPDPNPLTQVFYFANAAG